MQQQICQQEQMSNQQQQQVMLCPVRLVYETQILVQPGEQIQPNQTLFINPQNPPPWIQNRAQNQVIYMQQLPNNMMPSVPQHIDQNQLYIQNYAYPQHMMQVDQMRQMPNMMQNMMGLGTNVGHAIQNVGQSMQNVGQSIQSLNVGQNVMPMGSVVQNVQKVVPSYSQNVGNDRVVYSTIPNASNNTLTMPNNQAMVNVNQTMQERPVQMNQNLVNMQKVSELQGLKQQNVRPPQVTVSPMQNVKFGPNVGDVRPMAMPTRPQTSASNMNLVPNNMHVNVMAKNKVPLPNKASPNMMTNQIRNYNQTYYRPIQPRPMSVMPMVQNQYLPMQSSNLAPRPQTQINTELNRKRKSESPDETRKKIPNNNSIINNQIMTALQNTQNVQHFNTNNQMIKVVQSEIGVNTNPVQREIKQVKNVETMSTGTQANIVREKPQMENLKKALEIKAIPSNLVNDNFNVNVQAETDKLIRNTVFTQARGLLRTETQMLQPDIISIEKIQNVIPTTENVVENIQNTIAKPTNFAEKVSIETTENVVEAVNKEVGAKTESLIPTTKDVQVEIVIRGNVTDNIVKEPVKKEVLPKLEKEEPTIKNEEVKPEIKVETVETPKTEVKEKKTVKIETKDAKEVSKKYTVTAISDFKGNEIQIADGSVRKEDTDSYILTHVLDGYVIQESNMAFPIRKPLKERTIYQNTELGTEQKKEESYKHRTEDGKIIKDNSRILAISDLNLSEDDKIKEEEKTEEKCEVSDHPFSSLKPDTIKSWSVEELTAHLAKYNWSETIAVLAEHEIDGESLFLVSKPQLVQIGVSEAHADVICEFIKK